MMTDTHTLTHTHAYPWSYVRTNTLTHLGALLLSHFQERFMTHPHTSSCVLEICLMMTHIHTPIPTFDYIAQHIFLFHVYRSVSLARMRRYTQLEYLFHQCATSLFSRDSLIADCTVRHPGVERPFSSFEFDNFCTQFFFVKDQC